MFKKLTLPVLALLSLSAFVLIIQSVQARQDLFQYTEYRIKDEKANQELRDGGEWFSQGYKLHMSDRYREAIEAFKRSADLGHRKGTSMYNIACGYAMLDEKESALMWLEQALNNGFDRSDLLAEDSDLDSLRSDPRFKDLIAKFSINSNKRKEWRVKRDRFEEAIVEFERLNQESSRDGEEWYQVGTKLLQLRELDRAINALTQSVGLLPYTNQNALYNLACAYAIKGDREAGLEALERSINAGFDSNDKLERDPDLVNLRNDPRFAQIEKLNRTLSLSQFTRGNFDGSNYSKQRWSPAVAHFESFVKTDPNNGRAWFNLGYSLHYSREFTRAIEAFERALQLGYRVPTALYNMGCGHAMLGHKDEAIQWLERSLDAGFQLGNYIYNDDDLDSLRGDPTFKLLVDKINNHEHKEKGRFERMR